MRAVAVDMVSVCPHPVILAFLCALGKDNSIGVCRRLIFVLIAQE